MDEYIKRKDVCNICNNQQEFCGKEKCPVYRAPAADVAPVRRGHWIEDGSYQICSECGEEHSWGEYRATYCECCGARMDGRC